MKYHVQYWSDEGKEWITVSAFVCYDEAAGFFSRMLSRDRYGWRLKWVDKRMETPTMVLTEVSIIEEK